jgi:hypothetical protein
MGVGEVSPACSGVVVLRQAQHERRESGLGKHLDSHVDMIQTIVPYTKAALEGAK